MRNEQDKLIRGLSVTRRSGSRRAPFPELSDPELRLAPQPDRVKNSAAGFKDERGDEPSRVSDCRIIDLPKIADPRGNLTFIEADSHLPFPFKRFFYLYDVPGGANRAGHALKTCHQFIVAMSGSFDVLLDDGKNRRRYHLNRSYYGLYLPPLVWREIDNFSSGSVCAVLASDRYNEKDYFRDYPSFLKAVGGNGR